MSCNKPLTAYQPNKGGQPVFEPPSPRKKLFFKEIKLPCRQCIGCRVDKQAAWAARLLHEAQTHDLSLFITLTYDPENVPLDFGLHHEDFQGFMKRLRYYCKEQKIRFFMCGEYGTKGSRPHFHAILFGLKLDDLKEYKTHTKSKAQYDAAGRLVKPAETYSYYTSETLSEIWGKGQVLIGYATRETMTYVSGYMLKEQVLNAEGDYSIVDPETGEYYERKKPYIRMSTNPGIGAEWFKEFKDDVFPHDYVIVDGQKKQVPDYYLRKLAEIDPDLAEQIKQKRLEALKTEEVQEKKTPEKMKNKEFIQERKIKLFGSSKL